VTFSIPSIEPAVHAHWRLRSRGFPPAPRYHRETSYVFAVSHDLDVLKHWTALWACCISLSTLGFVLFLKYRSHYASPYGVTWPTTPHPQTRTLPFIAFSTHSALIQSRCLCDCFQSLIQPTCFATLSLLAQTSLLPLFSSCCFQTRWRTDAPMCASTSRFFSKCAAPCLQICVSANSQPVATLGFLLRWFPNVPVFPKLQTSEEAP